MKTHELKLDINYFEDVKSGKKNFEIRKNDRDFQIGDILELKIFDGGKYQYFNEEILTYLDCRVSRADTLKAKVLDIFRPEQINPDLQIINGGEYATNLHIALFLKGVSNVLKKHFNSDKVPDDYVVMAIEVIE